MRTQNTFAVPAPDPQAKLENAFLEEYLRTRGYTLASLKDLPDEESKPLMAEACLYASIKLTEIETRSRFVDEVHGMVQH